MVFNFLSNAVKFTPEGGQVTLRGERFIGSDGEAPTLTLPPLHCISSITSCSGSPVSIQGLFWSSDSS